MTSQDIFSGGRNPDVRRCFSALGPGDLPFGVGIPGGSQSPRGTGVESPNASERNRDGEEGRHQPRGHAALRHRYPKPEQASHDQTSCKSQPQNRTSVANHVVFHGIAPIKCVLTH